MSSLVNTLDTSSLLDSNCDITPELGTEASTTTTTKSSSVRRRKPTSTVWEQSRAPKDGEPVRERGAKAWYYKYCTDTPYRALSTTTARNHLKAKHKITTEQQDRLIKSTSNQLLDDILKRSRISKGDQEEIERTILKDAVNTKVLQQALSIFIITNDLSLRIIESPSLHALLKAANPVLNKEVISSHTAISSHISFIFLVMFGNLQIIFYF